MIVFFLSHYKKTSMLLHEALWTSPMWTHTCLAMEILLYWGHMAFVPPTDFSWDHDKINWFIVCVYRCLFFVRAAISFWFISLQCDFSKGHNGRLNNISFRHVVFGYFTVYFGPYSWSCHRQSKKVVSHSGKGWKGAVIKAWLLYCLRHCLCSVCPFCYTWSPVWALSLFPHAYDQSIFSGLICSNITRFSMVGLHRWLFAAVADKFTFSPKPALSSWACRHI